MPRFHCSGNRGRKAGAVQRPGVSAAGRQLASGAEHPGVAGSNIPPEGLGNRLDQMNAWLDANCGSDGWTMTPSSTRGVANDALAICFADATLASGFAARWCAMQRVEIVDGVYQVRDTQWLCTGTRSSRTQKFVDSDARRILGHSIFLTYS